MSVSNSMHDSPASTHGADDPDALNLLEYWQVLLDRRNIVFLCLGAVVVLGLVLTFLTTPQYRAATVLQIERHGPDILTYKDVVGTDPAWNAYQDFYETQYKILESRSVLRIAVHDLDLSNRPDVVSRKGSPISRTRKWVKSWISDAPPQNPDDEMERAINFIADRLSIVPVRNSHLVEVRVTDRDPLVARDVADAVAGAYQTFILRARYDTTEQASAFLTREVARLEGEVAGLERELQEYSTRNEIVAVSGGTADITEQALADLSSRYIEARSRRAIAAARYESIKGATPDSLSEVLNSPLINHLKEEYAQVERRHTQMADRFKPGWPALAQIREELEQTGQRLQIETLNIAHQVVEVAQSRYRQARAEVENLAQQVDLQKGEVRRVSRDAIDYAGLKEQIVTRRDVLRDLVARQSQTETSGQLRGTSASNIRVVDRAQAPDRPVSPRKALNLAVSLFVGLGLGVGVAILLHHVDNTIKTEQDIQRYAPGLAILGHIPLFQPLRVLAPDGGSGDSPPHPDLASHHDSRSGFAEAFKNLRTSLLLASPDRPPRHIVVTSCEPGDGKSTVALNLAIVLTQMGRRVLLVDADLRRPRIQNVLGSDNSVGLSSYLSGNASPDRLVHTTEIPLLDVVTSGPIPPNPSELLDSPRLNEFLEELSRRGGYEHVIFDSPPALLVADGVILATKMDATILVARAGATRREAFVQGINRLRQTRSRLAGTVLNALADRPRYYYYRKEYRYEAQPAAAETRQARRKRRANQG